MRFYLRTFFSLVAGFLAHHAQATHLFGADLLYTHSSGNTYTITMVVYGDCSGAPGAFSGLYTATPEIEVYNNGFFSQVIYLNATSTGVEVTPVCPSQINNTTCNGGTVPGVRRFIYSANINLPPSSNWLFRFTGAFMNNTLAGRSNTITNIISGTQMNLEATLNNLAAPNSSPTYTTIPTPFFCINKPAQYNPGAVDPDNDGLVFGMVPGLVTGGMTVNYITPFTATQPLATAPGTFSFSGTTGQLNFTPNLVQNALVVGKVEEFRNGVLVGSSMREMTFVVLNNCNNNPPGGNVSNPSGGVVVSNTTVRACAGQANFSFLINPSDLDGDNIAVTTAGVPAGASVNVLNNNSTSPSINFSWNLSAVAAGAYTFFVTYTDNGCPLSSKQTVAYTIVVTPKPNFTYALTQSASCIKKAVFHVTPTGTGPFNLTALFGASVVHTITNIAAPQVDSLPPGTFTIRVTDGNACRRDSVVTIAPPPVIVPGFSASNPACAGGTNGSIMAAPTGGLLPFQYALGLGSYSSNPVFTGLSAGTYLLHIRDANSCIKDTTVVLTAPPAILPSALVQKSVCATLDNGTVTLSAANGVSPYQYAIGTGPYSSNAVFTPLAAGSYVFHIKDDNNCSVDTTVTVADSLNITGSVAVSSVLCSGESNGSFSVTPAGGANPYTFAIGSAPFNAISTFSNLAAGTYLLHIQDANGCIKDTNVTVSQPPVVGAAVTVTQPACFDGSDGSLLVSGIGGSPGYTYAIDAGPFSVTNSFSGLSAGSYTLHIKDNNNCVKDTLVSIGEPSPIQISTSISDLKCFGDLSGMVTVAAAGGTPPFSYAADGGAFQASSTLSGLTAGMHTVRVKDANDCQKDTVVNIMEPQPLHFGQFAIVTPTCEGFADGSVTLAATGGTAPYQYTMNGGSFASSPVFAQLTEGKYSFLLQDHHGCQRDTTFDLFGYPHIIMDSLIIQSASCHGATDGLITIHASGGNPPLGFAIDSSPFVPSNAFPGLTSENHTVRILDAKGCKKDSTVFLPAPQVLTITPKVTNNDCIGLDDDAKIEAMVNGGTAPYTFDWTTTPPQSGQTATALPNGWYSVVVRDVNGCVDTASAEVTYDDCCTVFVPSGFTPNNDGRNDRFKVLYKGDMQLLQLSVYNRFGQKVFSAVNIDDHWDGLFNGQQQDLGTYYYYLQVLCGNQRSEIKEFKGDVTLIR